MSSGWENLDDSKKTLQLLITRLLKEKGFGSIDAASANAAFVAGSYSSSQQDQPSKVERRNFLTFNYCNHRGQSIREMLGQAGG